MSDTNTLTDTLDPKFLPGGHLHKPFHLAILWQRLGAAESAVHSATGSMDGPTWRTIEKLRRAAWSELWDMTNEAQRREALDSAQAWLKDGVR
jgi:hypothetical protein